MFADSVFFDRLLFLIIGIGIGLTLGVTHNIIIGYLRELLYEVHVTEERVDELVEKTTPPRQVPPQRTRKEREHL